MLCQNARLENTTILDRPPQSALPKTNTEMGKAAALQRAISYFLYSQYRTKSQFAEVLCF